MAKYDHLDQLRSTLLNLGGLGAPSPYPHAAWAREASDLVVQMAGWLRALDDEGLAEVSLTSRCTDPFADPTGWSGLSMMSFTPNITGIPIVFFPANVDTASPAAVSAWTDRREFQIVRGDGGWKIEADFFPVPQFLSPVSLAIAIQAVLDRRALP